MIIPNQKIEIGIVSTNLYHFIKLGYSVNVKDRIEVLPEHLMEKSPSKIKVKCDICKKEKEIRYNTYIQSINRYGKYSCSPKCSSFKCKLTKKERYDNETFNNRVQFLKTMEGRWNEMVETYQKNCLEKYDGKLPAQLEEVKTKSKQTKLKNHGDKNYNNREQSEETKLKKYGNKNYNNRIQMIESVTGIPYDKYIKQMPDFKLYRKRIDSYSRTQPLYLLKNNEKRANRGYWLEHMFSRNAGFKENIPIYIIGDIVNLDMLPYKKNIGKHDKCSITKEELFKRFDNRNQILKQLIEEYNKNIL